MRQNIRCDVFFVFTGFMSWELNMAVVGSPGKFLLEEKSGSSFFLCTLLEAALRIKGYQLGTLSRRGPQEAAASTPTSVVAIGRR